MEQGAGAAAAEAAGAAAASAAASALHANIQSKGSNSYYYAHKSTAPPEARYVSGDGPPQLVSSSAGGGGGGGGGAAAAPAEPAPPPRLPIESYQWCDDDADVALYIPLESVEGLAKEDVAAELSALGTTLTLSFPGTGSAQGRQRCLVLAGLFAAVSNARVLIGAKNKRVVVRLGKAVAAPWYKLLASDRPYAGDD
jgi:hypothetical protein